MTGDAEAIGGIAQKFLHHIAETGGIDLNLCTNDAVWWSMLGGQVPVSVQAARMEAAAARMYSGPGKIALDRVIVGTDAVVVEARGFQPLKNGKSYDNVYVWVISFRSGLISRVNHYFNPEIAREAMAD